MKVLLVEDEKRMSEALSEILRQEKYDTDVFYDGITGRDAAISGIYDIIILDVMLPKMSGFDIAKAIRKRKITAPILMLTAKNNIDDKVKGLDSGADDYITKPFEIKELLARLRALQRRNNISNMDEVGNLIVEDLVLKKKNSMLSSTISNQEVRLSEKEFFIIEYFMSNYGTILTREQIITKIWGYDNETEYNNLEVYISFTRRKLKFIESSVEIKAVRGIGYELKKKNV